MDGDARRGVGGRSPPAHRPTSRHGATAPAGANDDRRALRRSGNGVVLTEAGERVYAWAKDVRDARLTERIGLRHRRTKFFSPLQQAAVDGLVAHGRARGGPVQER